MKDKVFLSVLVVGLALWSFGCNKGSQVDPLGPSDLALKGGNSGTGEHSSHHDSDTTKSSGTSYCCLRQMDSGMMDAHMRVCVSKDHMTNGCGMNDMMGEGMMGDGMMGGQVCNSMSTNQSDRMMNDCLMRDHKSGHQTDSCKSH